MPANLEKMYATDQAWHNQAIVVAEVTMDHLLDLWDWHVESYPVYIHAGSEQGLIVVPNKAAQVRVNRDGTLVPLSVMSESYNGFSPLDSFAPMFTAITELGVPCTGVGTIGSGEQTFATFTLPEDMGRIEIDGEVIDATNVNLHDSLNGTSAYKGPVSMVRTVCENTFAMNSFGVPTIFNVRHTRYSDQAREAALMLVDDAIAAVAGFKTQVERLLNDVFTHVQFEELVDHLVGERPDKHGRALTMWENRREGLYGRYASADIAHCRNTKWGALMAVQGYEQHVQIVRNADRDTRHLLNVLNGQHKLTERAAAFVGV